MTLSRVNLGDCVDFSGAGFAPSSPVELQANSVPAGRSKAGSDGRFSSQVCFGGPLGVTGQQVLTARGVDAASVGAKQVFERRVSASVVVLGLAQTADPLAVGSGRSDRSSDGVLSGAGADGLLLAVFAGAVLTVLAMMVMALVPAAHRRHRRGRRR